MEFENFKFSLTEYELDENVPAIDIDFPNWNGGGYRDELEIPGDSLSIVFL